MNHFRILSTLAACLIALACTRQSSEIHVHEGESIQEALDELASRDVTAKKVIVHAGTYRPANKQMAFIWLNKNHDGITLEARGKVTLTAANPNIVSKQHIGYPAAVNHVIYIGDGVTDRTVVRGFEITGANGFDTTLREMEIEPNRELVRQFIYYADGGGIKVFGNSYPRIENVRVYKNMTRICGAGISIEQMGRSKHPVVIKDSIFEDNRVRLTGAAIDLLPGSRAELENVLVLNNRSNQDIPLNTVRYPQYRGTAAKDFQQGFENSSSVTVFASSRLKISRSTFVGNSNGVDRVDFISWYRGVERASAFNVEIHNSIFWGNEDGGSDAYSIKLPPRSVIVDSFIQIEDPNFDSAFVPMNQKLRDAGYRPAGYLE